MHKTLSLIPALALLAGCSINGLQQDSTALPDQFELPFQARGNEPPWLLTIDDQGLQLSRGYDQQTQRHAPVRHRPDANRLRMTAGERQEVSALLEPTICHDSMTGMPYPWTVHVVNDGEPLRGCGGSPAELLAQGEWLIENINHRGIIDSSRVSIQFSSEGRISGQGSCNRYAGSYTLTGEGLSFGPVMSTKMACSPALMEQERRFFSTLDQITHFDITPDGALLLQSHLGHALKGYLLEP